MLVRDQATLRDSLDVLVRHQELLNGSLTLLLEEHADLVVLREEVRSARPPQPTRQRIELALGVMLRLMRQFLGGPPTHARANYESASAWFQVHPGCPATLLLHGRNDSIAWHLHSGRLDERLGTAGVPRCYVALPWATHAFDFSLHGPGGQLSTFAVDWFLDRVTGG